MLAERLGFPMITMSDLLREEIATGSERGKKIKELIDAGNLAPQEVTNELLEKRLAKSDAQKGAVIDGYPRDEIQYKAFDIFTTPTDVILLDIPTELSIRRLAGRRNCECGRTYHMEWKPPKDDEICDECGAELKIRVDDNPEAIKRRLGIFYRETEPIITAYKDRGILHTIDGSQEIDKVQEDIIQVLKL